MGTSLDTILVRVFQLITVSVINGPIGGIVGALLMVTGNAILRSSGHTGYASNQYAAAAGAIGGAISYTFFGLIKGGGFTHEETSTFNGVVVIQRLWGSWVFDIVRWFTFALVAAPIGAAILWAKRDTLDVGDPFNVGRGIAAMMVGTVLFAPLVIPWLYRPLSAIDALTTFKGEEE